MKDPLPKNPNSVPPPIDSGDFVRPKKATRNSANDSKHSLKLTNVISKSLKKGLKKGSGKDSGLQQGIDGLEFEDDETEEMEVKDDGLEDKQEASGTDVKTQLHEEGMVGKGDDLDKLSVKGQVNGTSQSHVAINYNNCANKSLNKSTDTSVPVLVNSNNGKASSSVKEVASDMPVPFKDNLVLNPSSKVDNDIGNGNNNAGGYDVSGGTVWPSLNSAKQGNVSSVNEVGGTSGSKDVEMPEGDKGKSLLSFVNAVQGYGRASFARVLIEIDAAKGLVDNVEICYNQLGRSMGLKVEYPWKPPVCSHCKVFGHEFKYCLHRTLSAEEMKEKEVAVNQSNPKTVVVEKSNEGWSEVAGKGNMRNNGGRWSYGGRGTGSQRANNMGRNGNMQSGSMKYKAVVSNEAQTNNDKENLGKHEVSKDKVDGVNQLASTKEDKGVKDKGKSNVAKEGNMGKKSVT
ncbi:DUF4283 domain-containing protein [Artemisia annua]|uniref:DUF4283 domain-containing protein n=1 Tax=Artemisia annua TaxID=35608 RepID=A0A2U1L6Z7_ARTAN|nr:DUF4283 domain-containing protein [Artemisia annua]